MSNLTIRDFTKDDAHSLAQMISELADYEKFEALPHEELANNLIKFGFGEHASFSCKLGFVDEKLAGYALYCFPFNASQARPVLHLEDLYVRKDYRRYKLGTVLLSELAKIAIDKDCCRMSWFVLAWNESAQEFYETIGADIFDNSYRVNLTDQKLVDMANYKA